MPSPLACEDRQLQMEEQAHFWGVYKHDFNYFIIRMQSFLNSTSPGT